MELRRLLGQGGAAALLGAVTACGGAAEPLPHLRFSGATMGTTYQVTVVQPPLGAEQLQQEIDAVFARIDLLMSTWKADSELSRFNAEPPGRPFPVSTETAEVAACALEVAARSAGAFDPTVLPLVNLWGFGPAGERRTAPAAAEVAAAAALVDYRAIAADRDGRTLSKTRAGAALDFSAIAPGYAVDLAARRLDELGCSDYLVELGGELRGAGSNPRRAPWRIGIDRPLAGAAPGAQLQAVVEIRDRAVATSGDYRHYQEIDGRRVSHTIDPRSGAPIHHRLASVTVIAGDCMRADAYATAINVLGPEEGLRLAESLPGVEAYLIVRGDDGFTTITTPGFAAYLAAR